MCFNIEYLIIFFISDSFVLIDHEKFYLEVGGLYQPRVTHRGRLKNTIECADLTDDSQDETVRNQYISSCIIKTISKLLHFLISFISQFVS